MRLLFCLLLSVLQSVAIIAQAVKSNLTKVTDRIYMISHTDGPGGRVFGNTTVLLGDQSIMVIDAPNIVTATADIALIKQLSTKPVKFLVNTHWHPDHQRGNHTYKKAFPDVTILAHEKMPELMMSFEPGNLKRFINRYELASEQLKTGKDKSGKPLTDSAKRAMMAQQTLLAETYQEIKTHTIQVPDMLIKDKITLDLGHFPVEILHLGAFDSKDPIVVYAKNAGVLISGDIVVHPIPYFFAGFPYESIRTLEKLNSMEFTKLIPGHGPLLTDHQYVNDVLELMKYTRDRVMKEVHARGSLFTNVDEIVKVIDVSTYRKKFAGNNQELGEFFDEAVDGLIRDLFYQIDK